MNLKLASILLKHPYGWIACGFGSGLSPKAPGTAGSLAAIIIWYLLFSQWSIYWQLAIILAAFVIGIIVSTWTITNTSVQDPGFIVWDEFVGMWITLLWLPNDWLWYLAAFVLFRIFDIVKPWPVSWADKNIHGGLGVMLDDALAGVYALLLLRAAGLIC